MRKMDQLAHRNWQNYYHCSDRRTRAEFFGAHMMKHFPHIVAVTFVALAATTVQLCAEEKYLPQDSPRRDYNFDLAWKFFKEDYGMADGAAAVNFDDSAWAAVSTPHTFNDVDS